MTAEAAPACWVHASIASSERARASGSKALARSPSDNPITLQMLVPQKLHLTSN